jgi:hypothetical protein
LDGFPEILFPDNDFSKISDPVKIIWDMCRLGYPLCLLYNILQPSTPLEVKQGDNMSKTNASKRSVFLFIQACRTDLHIPEDELFKITDIFKEDTNLFVKVVNVLNILIKAIEERGFYPQNTKPLPFNIPNSNEIESPKDNRAKLVAELLNTERAYVQDLERLHNYQLEAESKILSKEDSIILFSNLGELLDFQRKFLIHMEAALAVPTQEQRIGHLFSSMESGFKVYQIICANQDKAAKFALNNCEVLMSLASVMEPKYELPSYLIKPVQRICKYPLLLNELMKYDTKAGHPYCHELQQGLDAIKRVTKLTNEIKRQEENEVLTEDLKNNIQDWKSVKVNELGLLLLRGNFTISIGENEREYLIYLFQNMLLCCQEKKKKGKTKVSYILKGSIYISSVTRVSKAANIAVVNDSTFALKIYWSDKVVNQCIILKCISEEQIDRWVVQFEKLIEIEKQKKQGSTIKENYDYDNHYISRVNQVDGLFTDEEYENKSVHSTHSMYSKPTSRNHSMQPSPKNLSRSKSQPNIFNHVGNDFRNNSKNQDVPPVPSFPQEYSYGHKINDSYGSSSVNISNSSSLSHSNSSFSSSNNSMMSHKNISIYNNDNSSQDSLVAPQRTVSTHVKHNKSLNNMNLRNVSKYNEPDEYNLRPKSPSPNQSYRVKSSIPLPPTPPSNPSRPSLYHSKSNSNLDEDGNIINIPERKVSSNSKNHSRPSKINIEEYSNNKYGSTKASESYEKDEMSSLSPGSSHSNNLSSSINDREPSSPTQNAYYYPVRNQYPNGNSFYKRGDYNSENTSYNKSMNDYNGNNNDYNVSRNDKRSDMGGSNMYNGRKSEYANEGLEYERNKIHDHNRSRSRDLRSPRERNGYDRPDMEDYEHYGRRRDYREEDSYNMSNRSRSRSRPKNPNPLYRNPSNLNNGESFSRDSGNFEKDRPQPLSNERILRNQNSVSSLSYDVKKDSNNTNSNLSSNEDSNTNHNISPRVRPSPPNTPNSRPLTPSTRPTTPSSRPTTPNLSSRLNNMNIRRPSTPLTSNSYNNNNNTENLRSSYTKIKVSYKDQEFVIPAPSSGLTYRELLSKIERKIRLNDRNINDTRPLRIRYKDEDNDFVNITNDEDVLLAFEVSNKIWKFNKELNNESISSMAVNLFVDRK